jgi:hypothetical protein
MSEIPIRPEAVEVVAKQMGFGPLAAIHAFCEVEGLTVESRPRADNPNAAPSLKEQRLVGPWRDVGEAEDAH